MLQNRIVPLLFLLVLILGSHHQSEAIPFGRIRILAQVPPPAPSPESDTTGNNSSKDSTVSDKCLLSSHSCSFKTLTACLRYSGNDLKEVFLIVENTGESPIQVNVTIAPANNTSEVSLTKQEVKEVNVTEKVQGSYAIVLSGSTGSCEIKSSSSVASGWKLPYTNTTVRLTPIYEVYILFVVVVIVGGVWGCCKFARSESRVENGSIPYQELEMAQQADSNNNDVETAQDEDGWGDNWDDDWDEDDGGDEIREVKSPRKANGHSSRSSNRGGDGWDDNWDD